MANYTCTEIPVCTNFQSAICLHCDRRLCLFHIGEHGRILSNDLANLSNEAKSAFDYINEDAERNKITYSNVLASLNDWRTEQIEKIEQIYQDQLQCVASQQQTLEFIRHELLRKLEDDGLQQLRFIQSQQSASMGVVNLIQQTIKQVRKESQHLNWLFPTPPTINIEPSRSNTTPVLTQQSIADEEISATTTHSSSKTNHKLPKNSKPFRRTIEMFANLSSIEQSKNDIDSYIRNQGKNFNLTNLVCSYLTAWYRKSNIDEKVFLLNEHISTIQRYLVIRNCDLHILIGIQAFFHNVKITEHKNQSKSIFGTNRQDGSAAEEMMTFLLQFFLNHKCINECLILKWYNYKGVIAYKGYELAKSLATSFINSISITNTVHNHQAVSTDQQHFNMHIKEEPVAFA